MCFLFEDIQSLQNYCYKTSKLKAIGGFVDFPLAWFSDDATNLLMAKNGCATTEHIVFGFRTSDINISSVSDESTSERKIDALIQYHHWFNEYLSKLSGSDISSELLLLDTIKNTHSSYVRKMSMDLLYSLKPQKFLKCLKELSREKINGVVNMTYNYIRFNITGTKA